MTTEHVHYWCPTAEAKTEQRVFSLEDGSPMRDRKGRSIGCQVRVRPMEIASRPRRDDFLVHPVVPEWEVLALGTPGFQVTIQATRDGHSFGASFPNKYYFTDPKVALAHIERAVGQAQARQRRQHRAGKL